MNLSTIRAEVRQELQDNPADTSAYNWTTAELNAYINDGLLLCQELTEWNQKTQNIALIASQQDYTLPTDLLHLQRVTYDRTFIPETRHFELDRDNPTWREMAANDPVIRFFIPQWDTISAYPKPLTAGTTYSFTQETGELASVEDPSGTPDPDVTFDSELGVVIAIEDSAGGQVRFEPDVGVDVFTTMSAELGVLLSGSTDEGNLGLFYSRLPDTLSADTDTPQLPSFVHPALVPYATFRAFEREGPHQDIKLAQAYWKDFGDWMNTVLIIQGRQWPDKVLSLEAVRPGTIFENRLSQIGPPKVGDLQPTYS